MSPSSQETAGSRPAKLKIHKDSHNIQKPTSSSALSSSSSSFPSAAAAARHHQPVIIYTHSPKVIHTQARDFMALVQKLTGLPHSDDEDPALAATPTAPPPPLASDSNAVANEESSSSSENFVVGDVQIGCSGFVSSNGSVSSPMFHPSPISHLDVPLEIPFFAPPVAFRCPEAAAFSSPFKSIIDEYLVPETGKPFLD